MFALPPLPSFHDCTVFNTCWLGNQLRWCDNEFHGKREWEGNVMGYYNPFKGHHPINGWWPKYCQRPP